MDGSYFKGIVHQSLLVIGCIDDFGGVDKLNAPNSKFVSFDFVPSGFDQGCTGQHFFASGRGGAGDIFFGAGRGRDQNSRGGAGRGKGQTLPGRGIFGAGQKDRKTINQC